MTDLAELRSIRDAVPPTAPKVRGWLMAALRGKHHGCGKVKCGPGCDQRGRWLIGKRLILSRLPFWLWTIGTKR